MGAESLQDDESDLAESASFVASRSMEPEGPPNKCEILRIFFYGSIYHSIANLDVNIFKS